MNCYPNPKGTSPKLQLSVRNYKGSFSKSGAKSMEMNSMQITYLKAGATRAVHTNTSTIL